MSRSWYSLGLSSNHYSQVRPVRCPDANWALNGFFPISLPNAEAWDQDDIGELAIVARRLWPRVQAHARND